MSYKLSGGAIRLLVIRKAFSQIPIYRQATITGRTNTL